VTFHALFAFRLRSCLTKFQDKHLGFTNNAPVFPHITYSRKAGMEWYSLEMSSVFAVVVIIIITIPNVITVSVKPIREADTGASLNHAA